MRFRMRENSLFAILLRAPWWVSFLIAIVIGLVFRTAMPNQFGNLAWFTGAPFFVIGCIAGWKQLFSIGKKRSANILAAVGDMTWNEFSAALTHAFRREGYVVTPLPGPAADFLIAQEGKSAVVCGKRWKAAKLGIEPLRELNAVASEHGAAGRIYVTLGDVSDAARKFAGQHNIDVLQGQRLVELMRDVKA